MGTTMSFYLIENRGVTRESLKESMERFQAGVSAQNRSEEERFGALLSAFLDRGRFEEVKDQMKRESPDTYEFVSRLLHQSQGESRQPSNVIPFPGAAPREGQERPEPDRKKSVWLACRPDARWLPLFEERLCEGYTASSRDTDRLARQFSAPVLAFSIFDSDILFVSYSDPENDIRVDYAKPNWEGFEEYDMDLYQEEFPAFLCAYADEAALREAWEGEEVFADDRMHKLCGLIGAQVLYDSQDLPEGFLWLK